MLIPIKKNAKASSPGRMDVMGGIADYSGSLLLQKAIKAKTTVEVSTIETNYFEISSGKLFFRFGFENWQDKTSKNDYTLLYDFFQQNIDNQWAAYVIGCFFVLKNEKNISFVGTKIEVDSGVPIGKGVSSSAALEIATMKALKELYQLSFSNTELSILAQKVENLVVGAPCGLMDQLACYFGDEHSLLPIVCQPDTLYPKINIPENFHFIGIDSGIKHAVGGASYSDVRTAAAMGYSIIAQNLGIETTQLELAKIQNLKNDLPFCGYLSNCAVSTFEKQFKEMLPSKMSGDFFLEKYKQIIDDQSIIKHSTNYKIAACTEHPIYENFRVTVFFETIKLINASKNATIQQLNLLGELMYQSHTSYSACELGEKHTDMIVEMAKKYNNKGIFGAKITGGGSGGTVCILAYGNEGIDSANHLYETYKKNTGLDVMFIE